MELRPLVKYNGRLQEVESGGKLLDRQSRKVVAVAYRSWSFTRSSICKAPTGKFLVFWIGGRLREVVAHGGSTVPRGFLMQSFFVIFSIFLQDLEELVKKLKLQVDEQEKRIKALEEKTQNL